MHPPAWLMRPDWNCLQRTRDEKKLAAGRGCRRSGFGQSREDPLPARARIGGLPDLRQCWSERGAFLQQPKNGLDKVGIEPTASRVQTGRSSAELLAHDPPRERGGDELGYVYGGWVGGDRIRSLVLRRHLLVRSSCNPGTWFSKTPGKRRTPAGEAGVRECVGRTSVLAWHSGSPGVDDIIRARHGALASAFAGYATAGQSRHGPSMRPRLRKQGVGRWFGCAGTGHGWRGSGS